MAENPSSKIIAGLIKVIEAQAKQIGTNPTAEETGACLIEVPGGPTYCTQLSPTNCAISHGTYIGGPCK